VGIIYVRHSAVLMLTAMAAVMWVVGDGNAFSQRHGRMLL
jgi:hypothetical protein